MQINNTMPSLRTNLLNIPPNQVAKAVAASSPNLQNPQNPNEYNYNDRFAPAVVIKISADARAFYERSLVRGVQIGINNTDLSVSNTAAANNINNIKECQTCSSRRYVDQSNDSSVSFQTPTQISPESAYAAVASHEREHIFNEQARADNEGNEVISQSVALYTDICPECGRVYVSGGEAHTVTASDKNKPNALTPYDTELLMNMLRN